MDTPATPPLMPSPPPIPAARTGEMLRHLSALAGFVVPLGNLIGPFLVWQLKKHEFPTVDAHGRQALNFQISCLIYAAASFVLVFVRIGIPLLIAVGVFNLVCVIMATVKVNDGKAWKYPPALPLIK